MRFAFVSTMVDSPWGGSEELWSQTAVKLKQTGQESFGIGCAQASADREGHLVG